MHVSVTLPPADSPSLGLDPNLAVGETIAARTHGGTSFENLTAMPRQTLKNYR
jgi:hypothetical protein